VRQRIQTCRYRHAHRGPGRSVCPRAQVYVNARMHPVSIKRVLRCSAPLYEVSQLILELPRLVRHRGSARLEPHLRACFQVVHQNPLVHQHPLFSDVARQGTQRFLQRLQALARKCGCIVLGHGDLAQPASLCASELHANFKKRPLGLYCNAYELSDISMGYEGARCRPPLVQAGAAVLQLCCSVLPALCSASKHRASGASRNTGSEDVESHHCESFLMGEVPSMERAAEPFGRTMPSDVARNSAASLSPRP